VWVVEASEAAMANEPQEAAMANEAQDSDREEEVTQAGLDDGQDPERKAQFLGFRQKMDEFKGAQEGMISEADNFKGQGNAYFSFGCYSQATIMYSEAIDLQPDNQVLYCNRSMAYLKQDMADLALADAERSLEIESSIDNIKAYWRKAQALLDLHRLEECEVAATEGLEIHGRNPHLNKVRRKARETLVIERLMAGDWVGKLDNGVEQRLAFSKDGEMTMTVFGHSLTSTYELSVEGNPRSMVVRMNQKLGPGSPPPTPPMVYIFEFRDEDKELYLCHPVDGSKELPTKFQGSGCIKHRRVEAAKAASELVSDEPLDVRCARYMEAMNKILPPIPPQLPEKPSDEQIKEEIEICGRVSELKRLHGLDVHRRAVELAKDPATAQDEEMMDLAQNLRRRFVSRKLLPEEPKALPVAAQPTPEPSSEAPAAEAAPPKETVTVVDPARDESAEPKSLPPPAAAPTQIQGKDDSQPAPDLLSRLAVCICCGSGSGA